MASSSQQLSKIDEIKNKSKLIEDGNSSRHRLNVSLEKSEPYRKITFGEKDENKPHKTILMVGETGAGKTTLINVMINYMLGVQREDKVWFEITDDQIDRTSIYRQTSIITVYEFYRQESPIHLTIIDTPGYGDICGVENDNEIYMKLNSLITSAKDIHNIHSVCLVIKASENKLSDRQKHRFKAVQCLFGSDFAENIVLLFTHSDGAPPKNVLTTVKEVKFKCAENDKKKPVYFLFNNCQSEAAGEDDDEDEEDRELRLNQSWNRSFKGMAGLFKFLDTIQPKSFQMSQDVFKKWKRLEANFKNLQSHVQMTELKQNELKQTQEALEKNKEHVQKNENFEYKVKVPNKKKIPISIEDGAATCCTICEENCHYPGCWLDKDLLSCSVMKNEHCTVCTNRCHYSKHVKEAQVFETKINEEKMTYDDLKKKYDGNFGDGVSLEKKLEKELQELEKEKMKLVMDIFHCVDKVQMIGLNTDSLITLQHIDSLIEKLTEINEPGKVKDLENIKKARKEKENSEIHK